MALLPFNDDSSGFQQIVRKRGPADGRRDEEGRGGGGDARSVSYLTKNLTDSSVILHYFHVREKYRLRGITLTSTHSRVFV